VFAVLILGKRLIRTQWLSLFILVVGVALVQLSDAKETGAANAAEQSKLVGFSAAITACVLSGLAGIYFEKILKGSDISVWMRNVQLSLLSIPFGIIAIWFKHSSEIRENVSFNLNLLRGRRCIWIQSTSMEEICSKRYL